MEISLRKKSMRDLLNYKKILLMLLKDMKIGQLTLRDNDEEITIGEFDSKYANPKIEVLDRQFYKKCILYGDIGFGEAYVHKLWDTDNLYDVLLWFLQNVDSAPTLSGSSKKEIMANILKVSNRIEHLFNKNNVKNSKDNISYHYDLSNDFYKLWLDSTMTYSSGLFLHKDNTLQEAQENKYASLCNMLKLKKGDHILEIGSGWGGFSKYAKTHYDVKITTITISKEQYKYASNLFKKENLEIDLRFEDYRHIEGKFDKIVSIEMLEAVGAEYLETYFQKCHSLLKPKGLFAFQVITSPDSRFDQMRKSVDFIQKHIFPGSLLPSIGAMNKAINKTSDLHLVAMKDMGLDYARTLNMWHVNFNQHTKDLEEMGFSETFQRKWNYYLKYCEAAFATRNISVVQMLYSRPNNLEH